jgi:hypothetical protein
MVLLVFGDPAMDLRMVVLGALLPDAPLRLTPLHSLAAPALALVIVMLSTRRSGPGPRPGRRGRRVRRLALAVPIGMLLHLVLDGMWARTDVFWWPLAGAFPGGRLPSLDRPLAVLVLQEAAGLAALAWSWTRIKALRGDGPGDAAGEAEAAC